MDCSRSIDPESVPADPAPTHMPSRPAAPAGGAAARLLNYQSAGGNQMVVRLLAAARQSAAAAPDGPSTAEHIQRRQGGGSPLPAGVRAEAEQGFGRPLGEVRVHTDAPAAALATTLNAHAFTTGTDIFFNAGQYNPGSRSGYEVLVHELAHTMQHPSGPVTGRLAAGGLSVSERHDPDEQQARAIAARLTAQRGAPTGSPDGGLLPGSSARRSSDDGPLIVHRHASAEHTMLGDTPPEQLGAAIDNLQERTHLLTEVFDRMNFFAEQPKSDPRSRFPQVRWVQLTASALWVSYGELNALPDYLADPEAADTMPAERLVPVLQKMRSGIRAKLHGRTWSSNDPVQSIPNQATHPAEHLTEEGGEVWALDNATAGEGRNRYQGLLARNACHFAPFSWSRWEQAHNEAREHARAHFGTRSAESPQVRHVSVDTEEHARQAVLKNGYADHFLQDSFAAGHLVNKTLIMQWWVDFLNEYNEKHAPRHPDIDAPIQSPGQVDLDVLKRMGSKAQPGVAGRELYARTPGGRDTRRGDRESGTGVTDPQTAQERSDRARRRSGSGVAGTDEKDVEANYQAYLRLLNNTQAQFATREVHDYLNSLGRQVITQGDAPVAVNPPTGKAQDKPLRGPVVGKPAGPARPDPPAWTEAFRLALVNRMGTTMTVGGDNTLLTKSDQIGATLAGEASRRSRQAIDDLMHTGRTDITTEQIFAYVPTAVYVDGAAAPVPLEQWHTTFLHDLCHSKIFPEYFAKVMTTVLPAAQNDMVSGGISVDTAPPPAAAQPRVEQTQPGIPL